MQGNILCNIRNEIGDDSRTVYPDGGKLVTGITTMGMAWVGLGGATGAVLRYLVVDFSTQLGLMFPLGTLLVNIAGSLSIGVFAGYLLTQGDVGSNVRLFFQTGLLGAFTTFSAFSLDTLILMQQGLWRLALINVLLNFILCLVVVAVGFNIAGYLVK